MKVKDWVENFERNIPDGYPTLLVGWPDEEHGITWGAYINELIDKLENLDEGDPLPTISFDEWKRVQSEESEQDDLGFSSFRCDLCGEGAGFRYAVTAFKGGLANRHDYVPLSVCEDCLVYTAYGDVPEWLVGEND